MNRRRFLAVAAAGASALASCNAIVSPGREGTGTPLPHRITGSSCSADPTGEYRFVDTLYVNDRKDADDTEWRYQWRFTLTVEAP